MSEHASVDDGGHPTPEVLADHAEGLLPPGQAAAVASHLLGCVECRDLRDALAEVSTLLTAYADPGPIPDDVAARLETALAGQSLRPADADEVEGGAAPAAGAAPTVVPAGGGGPGARTPWSSRLLQAAAVVVLLAAVTAIGFSAFAGGGSSGSSTGTADSATRAEATLPRSTGPVRITTSGAAYSQANLAALGRALAVGDQAAFREAAPNGLYTSGSPARPSAEAPLTGTERRLVDQRAALEACVTQLAGRPVTPIAVDLGTWGGSPATVVVLPADGDPATLDVFAVRPGCPPGFFLGYAHTAR